MSVMAFGVNYQTASLSLREKLACNDDVIQKVLRQLIEQKIVDEALLISTCNRTELYCATDNLFSLLKWITREIQLAPSRLQPFSYFYQESLAVSHLMRVACGLNSMMLGEVEILGQIKSAYRLANEAGSVGKRFSRLFQTTFSVAKQVRSQTDISVNPISVASMALRLAQHIFTDLKQATVLLIGAGDLMRLIAIHLKHVGVKRILLANRGIQQRNLLAKQLEATALPLDQMPERLKEADIIISGTSSILPIVGKGMVERALKCRKRQPMFMVDLAVPRDIEPEVGQLDDVYLYCIDDLKNMAEENRKKREKAVLAADQIIQKETTSFMQWMRAQESFGVVKAFREKFHLERDSILNSSLRQLKLGKSPEMVLQRAIHTITNRFLHLPTLRIRQAGYLGEEEIIKLTCELFELNNEIIHTE